METNEFLVNSFINFADGEVWVVVKNNGFGRITAKPFNELAKTKNISLAIEFDEQFIKDNILIEE